LWDDKVLREILTPWYFQDRPVRQARLGDAYEEALYGSESSDDEGEDDDQGAHKAGGPHKGANQKQTKKNKKNRDGKSLDNQLLEDDEDQIMDLLDGGRLANRALGQSIYFVL
jgi:hypothetical protein